MEHLTVLLIDHDARRRRAIETLLWVELGLTDIVAAPALTTIPSDANVALLIHARQGETGAPLPVGRLIDVPTIEIGDVRDANRRGEQFALPVDATKFVAVVRRILTAHRSDATDNRQAV
jgi:hypothetical protein